MSTQKGWPISDSTNDHFALPPSIFATIFVLSRTYWPQLASGSAQAEQAQATPKVDCHLHCFAGKDDTRFPYHERAPYQPDAAAKPEHLLKCMREADVDYAIVVHPEPYQDDHRYLEFCLKVGKGKLKGTLLLFADREDSLEKLPDLCAKLDVVSLRVHAYAPDRLPPFGRPELRELWKKAAEHGLAMQLHFEPRYAPGFEPLIREFSKVPVIIDRLVHKHRLRNMRQLEPAKADSPSPKRDDHVGRPAFF